jgi:hypothetical protein
MNTIKLGKNMIRSFYLSSVCLGLILGVPLTSQAAKTHLTKVTRMAAPPEGKALVNIYRIGGVGPFGADIRIPIFDESGKLLMDLPLKAECQFVFEPGSKSLITWFGANPIDVLTADLAPNKTYDLVFDVSVWKGGPYFVPLSQASHGLQNLRKLEKRVPKGVYVLERDDVALAFEASQKDHIDQIRADFLGGKKSDRVIHVNKDDCR